jgi:hypothetical protein
MTDKQFYRLMLGKGIKTISLHNGEDPPELKAYTKND